MKLLLLLNPVSGGKDKKPFLKEAREFCRHFGISLDIFETTGKNDSEKLAKHIDASKPDRIAAAGGDGTLQLAVTAMIGKDIPIGIIPLGSANGMASELNVSSNMEEALRDLALSSLTAPLDVLLVNGEHHCLHIGDVGLNARIVKGFDEDDSRGMATYAKHFIEQLRNMEPFGFTLMCNGKESSHSGVMAALCNARTFGTGIPLNSVGNPFDGKFEMVLIEKIRLDAIIKAGLSTFVEAFADNFENEVYATEKAELTFDEPQLLQLDGEVVGTFKELSIEILKGAVPLLTHADNPYLDL